MKVNIEINVRNVCFLIIIIICIFALSYAIYSQFFIKRIKKQYEMPEAKKTEVSAEEIAFDDLFDNELHLQGYNSSNYINKIEPSKDIVYTTYTLNEIYEGKYEIHASIPVININHEKVIEMDKEIISIFYDKIDSIIEESKKEGAKNSVYTTSFSAYLNENILSLVIKTNLKEGDNAQRVIIQSYAYNISTNERVPLKEMLEIRGMNINKVEGQIKDTVQEAINYSENLSSLGYEVYKRNIKDEMYKVENSDNYFIGPNESIYIIYAYGNSGFTTESDIVYIK